MTEGYRVAIAGCHRMIDRQLSHHNFASAFDAVQETEIVSVFDLGQETREDFLACWGDMPAYDDFEQMLQDIEPDIVCVATRQTMHASQIEMAVSAGVRGILCDKPLATSLAEADRIYSACHKANVPLAFGLDRRWVPTYQKLHQLIADGTIGDVTGLIATGLPNLINHGCHCYDAALMLAGDADPVWASGFVDDVFAEPPDSRRRMDPPGRGQVGLADGTVLYFTPAGGPGMSFMSFEVIGTTGRMLVLNDGHEIYILDRHPDPDSEPSLRKLDIPGPEAGWPMGPAMIQDLVQAIENKSRTACDIDQARRATEIGFAFHLSQAKNGARVDLPAADRTNQIPSFPWGNE